MHARPQRVDEWSGGSRDLLLSEIFLERSPVLLRSKASSLISRHPARSCGSQFANRPRISAISSARAERVKILGSSPERR